MKEILVAIIALSLLTLPAFAQADDTPGIKGYIILGIGIAASPTEPLDFMVIKFGIGRWLGPNGTTGALGVLIADEERYILRDILIEDGYTEGEIYEGLNRVGSFELSSVMKEDTEIWAGIMNLRGARYNVYVIEGARPVKAGELKDKVADYCRENDDLDCTSKIHEYCGNNPDDNRCQALFRAWCIAGNMDDTRCRNAFRTWCADHPADKKCVPFALQRARKYCEEHSGARICRSIATSVADFCEKNPDNEGCAEVKQMIENNTKLLRKVDALRDRITSIKTSGTSVESGFNVVNTAENATETGGG